jgi:murein DD-endopeptidase MepM/ murein hydrolase activator NlpD
LHAGVDLTPPLSTVSDAQALQLPILAFRDGTVTEVGGGFGVVGIDHGGGLETRYLHNSKIFVSRGQKVNAGQEIAKMGDAGSPGVIHAHFEVYQNGRPVDPAPVIFDSGKNPDPSKVKTTGNPRCVGQNS